MKSLGVLILIAATFANPNGAPKCSIFPTVITKAKGPEDNNLGYHFNVIKTENTTFEVSFLNINNRPDYQGLLMYVSSKDDPHTHIGKFTLPNFAKWKYQDPHRCTGIAGSLESTVTHASASPVKDNEKFILKLTEEEMQLENMELHSVIASTDEGKEGKLRWQILPVYRLTKRNGWYHSK
jgi:hypothetical protein